MSGREGEARCEEEEGKRKGISLKRVREGEGKKNGRGGGGGRRRRRREVVHGKEVKTLAVEVVEGGFLAAMPRENRSSSPSSSNKKSVFLGVFGEAFGWNAKKPKPKYPQSQITIVYKSHQVRAFA